jgi:hypothetical protein
MLSLAADRWLRSWAIDLEKEVARLPFLIATQPFARVVTKTSAAISRGSPSGRYNWERFLVFPRLFKINVNGETAKADVEFMLHTALIVACAPLGCG